MPADAPFDAGTRRELKKRNLAFFERRFPDLHDRLLAHRPSGALVFGEDGAPDVAFPGGRLYGGELAAFVERQLEGFWRKPDRVHHRPENAVSCKAYVIPFVHRLVDGMEAEGIKPAAQPVGDESYFLCVLGIGLGAHIDALVERTGCKALHVIDPSPEFLALSLEVYDWQALADTMDARGGTFWILIDDDPARIAHELRMWMKNTSPMAVDGATFFSHYRNEVLDAAVERFAKDLPAMLADLGFFYDESLMIRNTHHNLFSGAERVYRRSDDALIEGVPVFVVGTGPSLDKDIQFLKANRDKAVIVSAGTALRSLMVNGVAPDFQVESENIEVVTVLAETVKHVDVRDVTLAASTTVDTEAIGYFDKVLYFFREPQTPHTVFTDGNESCLLDANITVANAAIAFAQEAGFEDIYLFGIDMGSREGEGHHSKDSYHYTENPVSDPADLIFDVPVPANFGGTSLASKGFTVALLHIERSIRRYGRARRHFNCSDGARIEGAAPVHSAELDLAALAPDAKAAAIEAVEGLFHPYPRDEFDRRWNDAVIRDTYEAFLDEVRAAVAGRADFDDLGYMTDVMQILGQPLEGPRKPIINLFTGSLFQALIVMEYYRRRLGPEAEVRVYEALFKDAFAELVENLRDAAAEAIGSLTAEAGKG